MPKENLFNADGKRLHKTKLCFNDPSILKCFFNELSSDGVFLYEVPALHVPVWIFSLELWEEAW